ncbi:hypothetical protein RJ640_004252 [Escallonia rubra]|uniref:Integrase catalytic domain-containing protein n=1 Tax=Escallonia rubra TaxID=112253 RepID=A0AA88UNK7_9ASTE|nr:hypothetical protein RJ640_004252 [Escallonia rubra]
MSKIPVKGKGKIFIELKNGGHQFISNVYNVLEMKANILSMGQLLEKGYGIHMKDMSLYLRDDKKWSLIARVPMSSNMMFLMNIHHEVPKCLKACIIDNQLWLWHLRLGHLKFRERGFSTFKKFKALVEKHNGYQIKEMRFDRGGEFTSKEFKAFCEENSIRRPLTILYSPQQNGVVERKNRSIMNMTRSMLKNKNFPKEFWAEAVDCAIYLSNQCQMRSNNVKIFDDFKNEMAKEFEMTDISLMSYYLAIEINQRDDEIFISQEFKFLLNKTLQYSSFLHAIPLEPSRADCSELMDVLDLADMVFASENDENDELRWLVLLIDDASVLKSWEISKFSLASSSKFHVVELFSSVKRQCEVSVSHRLELDFDGNFSLDGGLGDDVAFPLDPNSAVSADTNVMTSISFHAKTLEVALGKEGFKDVSDIQLKKLTTSSSDSDKENVLQELVKELRQQLGKKIVNFVI